MMTPEEARKAWVEALRSGEYEQGKHYLTLGDKDCCLGVACKLAIQDGVPVMCSGQRASSLSDRNDQGASFKKIAAIIDSEPKGLFTDG